MSSTQFVEIYHPQIASTIIKPVRVSLQSVDDHAANGWLRVDDGDLPTPSTPYYTTAAADSRFAKVDDIDDPETLTGERLRAAFVAAVDEDGGPIPGFAGRIVFNADGDPLNIELVEVA